MDYEQLPEEETKDIGFDTKKSSSKKREKKIPIFMIVGLLAIVLILLKMNGVIFNGEKDQTKTITKSSLQKVLEVSDLSTIEYVYNGFATVTEKDNPKDIKYHVAYEGEVLGGINFKDVKFNIKEEEKIIEIITPQPIIQNVSVEPETLDFIFLKNSAKSETLIQEAYNASVEDIETSANNEDGLLKIAKENAIDTLKALYEPLFESTNNDYKITVR